MSGNWWLPSKRRAPWMVRWGAVPGDGRFDLLERPGLPPGDLVEQLACPAVEVPVTISIAFPASAFYAHAICCPSILSLEDGDTRNLLSLIEGDVGDRFNPANSRMTRFNVVNLSHSDTPEG